MNNTYFGPEGLEMVQLLQTIGIAGDVVLLLFEFLGACQSTVPARKYCNGLKSYLMLPIS